MKICRLLFGATLLLFVPMGYSKKVYKPVSDEQAKKYLLNFGYVAPSNVLSATSSSSVSSNIKGALNTLKNAIKKFQKFAGLKSTGELDDITKRKMAEPRCGVTDVMAMLKEPAAFTWPKNDLTYSIQSYPTYLSRKHVDDAIAKAFKKWSAVSPLNFKQVPSNGDIVIQFAYGRHGDPWPFDGKGGVLAHATFPTSGNLHFDEDENWAYMTEEQMMNYMNTDLLSVAVHEIGHTLGLEHSYSQTAIMAPFYQDPTDSRGNYKEPALQQDDIKRIQLLYGPRKGSLLPEPTTSRTLQPESVTTTKKPKIVTGESGSHKRKHNHPKNGFDWHSGGGGFHDCPYDVDSAFFDQGRTYLFSSTKVYEINDDKIINVQSLHHLFPMSPAFTQGAFAADGFVYIFDDRSVYKYVFDRSRVAYKLQLGYPKRLPYELRFAPMGAINWMDNRQYLFNANEYATYVASSNRIIEQGDIKDVFKNFPPLEALRGAVVSGNSATVFTDKRVFKYAHGMIVNDDLIPIREYLGC